MNQLVIRGRNVTFSIFMVPDNQQREGFTVQRLVDLFFNRADHDPVGYADWLFPHRKYHAFQKAFAVMTECVKKFGTFAARDRRRQECLVDIFDFALFDRMQ